MAKGLLSNIKQRFTAFFKLEKKEVMSRSNVRLLIKKAKDYKTNQNVNLGTDTETVDANATLMEKTEPDIKTAIQIRIAAIMSLNVDFKGKGAGLGAATEFAQDWWDGLRNKYSSTMAVIKSSITRGFGVMEKEWIYDSDTGFWIIGRLINHSIKHFEFGDDNELLVVGEGGTGTPVDEAKYFSVLTFQEDDGNRYGVGLYEQIYWCWYIKNNAMKFWSIFTERMVDPNIIVTHGKLDIGVQEQIEEFLNDQMTGANVIIPAEGVEIKALHKMTAAEVAAYEAFCRYLDNKFHMAITGNLISADKKTQGISFETSSTQEKIRTDILWSDVKWWEAWFNDYILYPQVAMNFPNIKRGDVKMDVMIGKTIDPEVFRKIFETLNNAGVDQPLNHTMEQFGIPNIKEGEEVIKGKSAEVAAPIIKPNLPNSDFSDVVGYTEKEMIYLKKVRNLAEKNAN